MSKSNTLSSKGRCPDLMNVYRRVYIAVVRKFAFMANPRAHFQIHRFIPMSAVVAYRRCGLPSSDGFNALCSLLCLPSSFEHELTEGQIRNFASPEAFHALQVEVFKETDIKLSGKFKCEFPMMIGALIGNLAMLPCIVFTRPFAIVAATFLFRQGTLACFTFFAECL